MSGGGKSTLLIDTLYKAVARKLNRASEAPAPHDRIEGLEHIDKIIDIDQSPIGRTPRSNPATYTGAFTPIRELFAGLPESQARGYEAGRFSFNVKGGRCEACQGDGVIKIEMHFLPDVYVTCEVCKGKRYNRETLEVTFKGKSIADVLDMTVEEAADFFQRGAARARPARRLLHRVGLGYIHLGQQATTLSGGEAQRVKLAKELAKRATGRTLYILDEPTTGLHFHDVPKLLEVLHELVDDRQHGRRHRTQSRSDQDRRLDHRSRPGRRRRRRRDRVRRPAGGHRARGARAIRGAFLKPVLGRQGGGRCWPGRATPPQDGARRRRGEHVRRRFYEANSTMTRSSKEFIREGRYAAEVPVELIEDDTAWSPYLSPDDVRKLETVRLALRRGDIAEAAKHGRVFELTPVAG